MNNSGAADLPFRVLLVCFAGLNETLSAKLFYAVSQFPVSPIESDRGDEHYDCILSIARERTGDTSCRPVRRT